MSRDTDYRRDWRGVMLSRGSGSGSGLASGYGKTSDATKPKLKPLGTLVDQIRVNTLLVDEVHPTIEKVEYVSSYNWLDAKAPIILVPGKLRCASRRSLVSLSNPVFIGSPPAWSPPVSDVQLKQDSQDVFRDINAARYPLYPVEPTIRAVMTAKPEFDLQGLDVIGCGSTIGNLLKCAGNIPNPFRFDVEVLGTTVVLIRKENSPTEVIQDLRGYGHTFPEAYTTWDAEVRNSCSHQRIIHYEFGGMKLLVRSETDGYLKQVEERAEPAMDRPAQSVENILVDLGISSKAPTQEHGIEIRNRGARVPQTQIFDIKTRREDKPYDMTEILPRLWINQTPHFLIAYHKYGLFNQPRVRDVKHDVLQWQTENSQLLSRFHAVLKRIVNVVLDMNDDQFEVSWDGEGPLCITKELEERRRALPSELLQIWKVS